MSNLQKEIKEATRLEWSKARGIQKTLKKLEKEMVKNSNKK